MIVLHSSSGAADFEPLAEKPSEEVNQHLFTVARLLAARGKTTAAGLITTVDFSISHGENHFGDEFHVLHATVALEQYEYLRENQQQYREDFRYIAEAFNEIGVYVRFIACYLDETKAPENWRGDLDNLVVSLTANQALFTYDGSSKITHRRLKFRSRTETRIFDELVTRGLLVMPLPVAVLGLADRYREPDMVVVYKGKVGILEVHGDPWHPPETAAAEHERRREFTRLGVAVYEIFSATRCWDDPKGVVDEFLSAFDQ